MPDYGSGGIYEVTMDGPFSGGAGTAEKITQIVIPKASWKGATSPYSQKLEIPNASVNSKVDIQIDAEQLDSLSQQKFSLVVGNLGGEFTVYSVGDKPAMDIEIQISLTDVLDVGSESRGIFGNTVSTVTPRPDYGQVDEFAADFIRNKPELVDMVAMQITLMASNWENKKQTVSVSGVEASNKQAVITVSAPDSLDTYLDCNIRLAERGAGTLTFECDDVPGSDVFVNALIIQKGVLQNG